MCASVPSVRSEDPACSATALKAKIHLQTKRNEKQNNGSGPCQPQLPHTCPNIVAMSTQSTMTCIITMYFNNWNLLIISHIFVITAAIVLCFCELIAVVMSLMVLF